MLHERIIRLAVLLHGFSVISHTFVGVMLLAVECRPLTSSLVLALRVFLHSVRRVQRSSSTKIGQILIVSKQTEKSSSSTDIGSRLPIFLGLLPSINLLLALCLSVDRHWHHHRTGDQA